LAKISADLFVGPNQKHVYPSETLLTKMGLNREIDRLVHKLGRDPEDRKSLYDLARAYYLRSDWLNLHRVTQKILQIDPLNPRAVADMSRALIYLGRVDESVATIEERLKRGPDPLLTFRLGQCLVVRARDRGTVSDLLDAIVRKQQLSTEALRESSNLPGINRWIRLDLALDNLSVSDPLELNQPTVQGLEALYREYELTSDKGLSILSRISLATRKMLAAYSLYLVYRRHRHPKTGQLLRRVIQMDPDSVLANRVPHLKQVSA
jgi:tetratricopeptide (TPR) repeat protein